MRDAVNGNADAMREVKVATEGAVDAETIRQIAGHSTVLSTRGYMHVSTDAARAALDRLGE